MKIHVLVLSYVSEGGEWFATERLLRAVVMKYPALIKFSFVGLVDTYLPKLPYIQSPIYISRAKDVGHFGFVRMLWRDMWNARIAVLEQIRTQGDVSAIWTSDYLMILVAATIADSLKICRIFHFLGRRSAPIVSTTGVNYRQKILQTIERLAVRLSGRIIVPSREAMKYMQLHLCGTTDKKKYHVVPNIVPKEFFHPQGTPLNATVTSKTILYSGALTKHKGLENLLEGYATFAYKRSHCMLTIAYPSSSAEEEVVFLLHRKIKKLRLQQSVRFVSDSSLQQLSRLYAAANVVILPSEFEVAPLVVIEAFASGTPCIGTNVGNVRSLLSKIDPTLILANNSSNEIAEKLSKFFCLSFRERVSISQKCRSVADGYTSASAAPRFFSAVQFDSQ